MSTDLHVVGVGHATLQDLGRPGYVAVGIPGGGAADQHAARTANTLVGNADAAPLIEVTASGLSLRAEHDVLLAVTGAADHVFVAGSRVPSWELLAVHAGAPVDVPAPTAGLRSYVAVNGRIHAPSLLGSVAPEPLLDSHQRLIAGEVLTVETALTRLPAGTVPYFRLGAGPPSYSVGGISTVGVTAGPESELLNGGLSQLTARFTVTPQSNHVGLRLDSPPLDLAPYDEILSRGVPVGAVELPPSGGVIVLLRGRLVTAGYPVVAVVTSVDVDVLGQLRPGDAVRFEPTPVEAAVSRLRARRLERRALASRTRTALAARGLDELVHPFHASSEEPST
jgi:5-oxoprolinase (ATP-hydrolysing) subunit C